MTNAIDPTAIDQKAEPPSPDTAQPFRLGCVSYLNTLPLIEGLAKLEGLRLTLTAPSRLIDLLLADEIDMGLVSIIDYQRSPESLVLLPAGMIGCDGPTLTVRLFSSRPIDQIAAVHADADSHTSVALLRIIMAERAGTRPQIIDFDADAHRAAHAQDAALPWPQAVLLIGDKVVTDSPPAALYPHQLDLGEAWKQLTGLPFVYAMWMCRQSTLHADSQRIALIAAMLDRQRRHNQMRREWIADTRGPVRGWTPQAARHYLGDLLRFDVTSEHRAGVERFFDLAHHHGLIPTRKPTLWTDTL